jgi:transketolase
MGAVSRANIALVGSHAGVSIGEDGPSQMALEDIASLRAVHGSTVLYPSDANQTAALVPQMADREGIVFMRTTREKTPILYEPGEDFVIGGARVVRESQEDTVTLIAAGITLHEAITAADALRAEGISARIIDLYSVKPVDSETVLRAARETGAIVTVEDHWPEGGIGDAVLDVLAAEQPHPVVTKLAVRGMPTSGTPAELMAAAGIDAEHIAEAARMLVSGVVGRERSTTEVGGSRRQ